MSQTARPLIGSVFERKPGSKPSPPSTAKFSTSSKSGFPSVQHRSKSAFARGREASKTSSSSSIPSRTAQPPPVLAREGGAGFEKPAKVIGEEWRREAEEANRRKVVAMSAEEREEERRDIVERFGPGIADVLKRAREARERAEEREQARTGAPAATEEDTSPPPRMRRRTSSPPPTPTSILSSPTSRSSSPGRANRKLRFADVTPDDVFVYESAPSSPKRKALALPAPTGDDDTVSLGAFKLKPSNPTTSTEGHFDSTTDKDEPSSPANAEMSPPSPSKPNPSDHPLPTSVSDTEPEEGSPEYIRRRFFPSFPPNDPSLAWIQDLPPPDPTSTSSPRFDLTGAPIPPALSETLPTHLGLHHHANGTRAGYTLDDIFLLARSSVPAQRATMLGVLAGIARNLGRIRGGSARGEEGWEALRGKEEEVRERILAAGVAAMGEKGGVGARAADVLCECVVGWDEEDVTGVEGVELRLAPSDSPYDTSTNPSRDALSALPLDFVLPQIASIFEAAALPHASLLRVLSVLYRLARHATDIATDIVSTPALIPATLRLFLLTPIPPPPSAPPPTPLAIHLLRTLVLSSRQNATSLLDPIDSLLRFLALLPPASPYPPPLANALITETLRLYASLASYGLYAHIATTASEPLTRLSSYIHSLNSGKKGEEGETELKEAYARTLEGWITCAIDPHRTTPEHEILWSQVVGWGWAQDLQRLKDGLGLGLCSDQEVEAWAVVWSAQTAWLEGARVNGVRGGEEERRTAVDALRPAFANGGKEGEALARALDALKTALDENGLRTAAPLAKAITAATRLWLACCPSSPRPPAEPPFALPYERLGALAYTVATHPFLTSGSSRDTTAYARAFTRPLSTLCAAYVRLARRLPGTDDGTWLGMARQALLCMGTGDEDAARELVESILGIVNEDYFASRGVGVPSVVWERGGMHVIAPFLTFRLRPDVAPLSPTPRSIQTCTMQTLPTARLASTTVEGLPYAPDWPFLPLEHLLRSGTSKIWENLPRGWDASETEVVRAVLVLAGAVGGMRRAEVVFGCMRVFMLEHGQVRGDGEGGAGGQEVFRDAVVGGLMEGLLEGYTLRRSSEGLLSSPLPSTSTSTSTSSSEDDLESVAARHLGPSTPFYQFYADFVALYDAISFAHPLFAALLLPPTARAYPADYRKLLWADTAHVLGTVRTPVEWVVGRRAGEWLWPVEEDARVLGAYVGALVGRGRTRGELGGFVRWVAVHHVAGSVWPDLREGGGERGEERARKLLEVVVRQGGVEVVREVVGYWQRRVGEVAVPPMCFGGEGVDREGRKMWVRSWAGEAVVRAVEGVLGG